MNIATILPGWGRPRPNVSPSDIDDDIRAELEFHLTQLEEEFARQGAAFSEAKALAREQFGDPDEYFNHCRKIKMHDRVILQRVLLCTSLVLVAITCVLGWQVVSLACSQQNSAALMESMRLEIEALRGDQAEERPPTPAPASSIEGTINDALGQPIVGARVLATIKTWPGGVYRQQSTSAVTDEQGRYKLPQELPHPKAGTRAIQIAVVAEGYAFESQYLENPPLQGKGVAPINFSLESVAPFNTRLVYDDGSPVAGVPLFPCQRRTPSGEQHLLYFVGSEPVHCKSDAEGYVDLAGLAPGDEATLYVRTVEEDWKMIDVKVDLTDDTLIVTIPRLD